MVMPTATIATTWPLGRRPDVADELLADVGRIRVAVADPVHRHDDDEVHVRVAVDPVREGLDGRAGVVGCECRGDRGGVGDGLGH
jgi:hypothetical protein